MTRDLRIGIYTLTACFGISMMLVLAFAFYRLPLSMYNIFLYVSVPVVLASALLRPAFGAAALLFFIALSPTEWSNGIPILSFDYPFLKPGINLFDGLFLLVTLFRIRRSPEPNSAPRSLYLLFFAYAVCMMVSVQISAYSNGGIAVYSLYILLDILRMALLFVHLTAFKYEDFERVNLLLMISAVVLVLYMFSGQAISNVEGRLSTLGLGPNGIGGFYPLLIPLSLTFVKKDRIELKVLGVFCFLLLWTGLLLSESRSGMLGAAVGTGLIILLISGNKLRTATILGAISLPIFALMTHFSFLSRFSSNADNGRLDIWINSFEYMKDNIHILFWGLGPGMYYEFALNYLGIRIGSTPEHAHNLFLTKIMENGLVPTALELLIVIVPMYLLLRSIRRMPVWLHGYWVGLVSYHIHGLADYTLWLYKIFLVYWYFAFALWLVYRRLSQNGEEPIA